MAKYVLNYESGDFEWITEDGYSIDRGEYVYNWDDSEYQREREEEEEEERHREEEEEREREEEEERQREEEEEREREEEENSWGCGDDDEW